MSGVEEIGAPGPIFVEDAAREAAKMIRELRERAEKAERELDSAHASITAARAVMRQLDHHISEHAWQELDSALNGPSRGQEDAQARLARYEAPGPALLVAEHAGDCYAAEQDMDGHEVEAGDCDCGFDLVQTAYREQHARCMAVVERLMREIDEDPRASHLGLYAGGVRMALAALTGEAEK